ncbi:hypothetical protein QJS10_CPB15g00667 [Acorus calamus]|uniref:TraB domain-containing protein n=1 Tax=Acorus calamus TaxID=4465 RepID=A0AAV9D590_ACOCL|nr:hypothetical protein QJS10_CPB15g00667 [Acorus calamus]
METLTSFVSPNPNNAFLSISSSRSLPRPSSRLRNPSASIRPPPPGFDYRDSEVVADTRAAVAGSHPDLLDLVDRGSLVVVEKRRFGPVPPWREGFAEPEAIWLVGTTHLSEASASEVGRVVRSLRPDNVVVELCRSRAGIMYASKDGDTEPVLKSNMFSLGGSRFFDAISRSINLGGQSALALRLLLAVFSSKLSTDANRPFGDEFRAARIASEEVGSQIVLGDRPIEITLERAWDALTLKEKLNLIVSLFRGITSPSSDMSGKNLEDGVADGSPFQLYKKLSVSFPSLLQPLIHERDTYLSWSLKRSKAVNNSKKVVGIIGKGHLNGVIYALVSDLGDLRFRDLAGQRSANGGSGNWTGNLVKGLVRDTIIGFAVWALFEQLKTSP